MAAKSRTRKRVGRAKGGKRAVSRTHTRSTPKLGSPGGASTKRKGTVTTKGGLKRTANVSKTTTGTGAGRVVKKVRTITRVKNGRKVVRKVTTVNRGGKVTTTKTAPKVTGKGPQSTKPKAAAPRRPKRAARSGGTSAPRRRKRK
jgi:hypothetical protein